MPPKLSRLNRVKFESFGRAANVHGAWFYKKYIQGIGFRIWRSGRHVEHSGCPVILDVEHGCISAQQGQWQWI